MFYVAGHFDVRPVFAIILALEVRVQSLFVLKPPFSTTLAPPLESTTLSTYTVDVTEAVAGAMANASVLAPTFAGRLGIVIVVAEKSVGRLWGYICPFHSTWKGAGKRIGAKSAMTALKVSVKRLEGGGGGGG